VLDEVQRLAQQSLIVVGVGPAEPVSQPLDLDPFRSADPIRDVGRLVAHHRAVEDERRSPDGTQHVADVALHAHAVEGDRRRGTGASPHVPDEPVQPFWVCRADRAHRLRAGDEIVAIAPPVANLAELAPPVVFRRDPGVVGRPQAARARVVEDEGVRTLGIRGGEEEGDPAALLRGPERRALGLRRVHDRPDVVHPRLERRHLAYGIGEAASTLVEQENSADPGEAVDVVYEERHVPTSKEVGELAPHEDDVLVALADDLVGDRDPTAPGVEDVRDLSRPGFPRLRHVPILPP
jgi:hypothetical protein